jgi:hypothetical protein
VERGRRESDVELSDERRRDWSGGPGANGHRMAGTGIAKLYFKTSKVPLRWTRLSWTVRASLPADPDQSPPRDRMMMALLWLPHRADPSIRVKVEHNKETPWRITMGGRRPTFRLGSSSSMIRDQTTCLDKSKTDWVRCRKSDEQRSDTLEGLF